MVKVLHPLEKLLCLLGNDEGEDPVPTVHARATPVPWCGDVSFIKETTEGVEDMFFWTCDGGCRETGTEDGDMPRGIGPAFLCKGESLS